LNPLRVVERKLYPDDFIVNFGQEDLTDFTIKVDLANHQNTPDLNNKAMGCTMTVLYRDNTTIYRPGQDINFTLGFSFYDIPRGDLLEANAKKILEVIDEAETIGSWFDTTYSVYTTMASVCNGLYSARGITSTFSSVVSSVQIILASTLDNYDGGLTSGFLGQGSHGTNGVLGTLTDEKGVVSKVCGYVTCRNGGLLGELGDVPGFGKLVEVQNGLAGSVCTFGGKE